MKSIKNANVTPDMLYGNDPIVSIGRYLNFWTMGGDYDVHILFHELQENMHADLCEHVVHLIMASKKPHETKEKVAWKIEKVLSDLIDWEVTEPYVFITEMK